MAKTEYAWVIERGDSSLNRPVYFTGGSIFQWEVDHEKAIRFSRREDAERLANGAYGELPTRVVEHGWA